MPSWKKVITSGSNATLAQISASIVPTVTGDENLLAYDSTTGGITQITQVNAGDNLGNHTATQTLDLGNNAISNALTLNTLTVGSPGLPGNTAVGVQALLNNTNQGFQNVAVGFHSLEANTTGDSNVAVGHSALENNTSGGANVAVGYKSLENNINGSSNIALGYLSMRNNTSGIYNTAIGRQALDSNTTGENNIALGYRSLSDNTSGDNNVALGFQALLENTTGFRNIALGYKSSNNNITGNQNISLGYQALFENTTGDRNIALGDSALYENTTGENNIALGADALRNNTTGDDNIAIGHEAGKFLADGSNSNQSSNNIFIGKDTRNNEHVDGGAVYPNSNTIVIGVDAISVGKNSVVLGNDNIELTALKGKVGIGTTAPTFPLHIESNTSNELAYIRNTNTSATTSDGIKMQLGPSAASSVGGSNKFIAFYSGNGTYMDDMQGDGAGGIIFTGRAHSVYSDIRNKNSIVPIESSSLNPQEIINNIDVIEFKYNAYDWHSEEIKKKHNTEVRIGVSAQQLKTVLPTVVSQLERTNIRNNIQPGNPGYKWMGVSYEEIVPLLIQTSKEQNTLIQKLEERIKALEG
jgi:hypothetical protein